MIVAILPSFAERYISTELFGSLGGVSRPGSPGTGLPLRLY